jgi:hypothetical protein
MLYRPLLCPQVVGRYADGAGAGWNLATSLRHPEGIAANLATSLRHPEGIAANLATSVGTSVLAQM